MSFIKKFESFKNSRIDEAVGYGPMAIPGLIALTFKPALDKLGQNPNVEEILQWIGKELLSPGSSSFLFKPILDEVANPGTGKWNKPGGVSGDAHYYMDSSYIAAMAMFSEKSSLLGEKEENVANSGLEEMQKLCSEKFKDNKLPWTVIRYCLVKARQLVAAEIKYLPYEQRSKNSGFALKDKKIESKVPLGCFIDEAPSKHLPELKKVLIECGGRDLGEDKNALKELAKKKKAAFLTYFKGVLNKFSPALKKITEQEISEFLKKNKIGSGEGYKEGEEVIYLRRGKTMDDWKNLPDKDKESLGDSTKEIVGSGKITAIDGDSYTIEFKKGEKTVKSKSEIVKKA